MRNLSLLYRLALVACVFVIYGGMTVPKASALIGDAVCSVPHCLGCPDETMHQQCLEAALGGDLDGIDGDPLLDFGGPLKLIQPLDDATTQLPPEPGIGIFFTYFNLSWPWVIGVAAGIAVLQALYGGILIMISGGKEQKEEGKNKLMWALAGLLLIGLSGMILETLNPLFYIQV